MESNTDLAFARAVDLIELYRSGSLSPVEVVSEHLRRIEAFDQEIRSFITVADDLALAYARQAEHIYKKDAESAAPLLGVPIAVKDTEDTAEIVTTNGSRLFQGRTPTVDSILVERLRSAGAIIIGKTSTPEFGMGGITTNPISGYCANPWNSKKTTGGSSGGSAAAVAAGFTCLASGSDGAGSINIPSAFCGVFGMKPSHRRIPYWPMPDPWPTFMDCGPITRGSEDAALVLRVLCGPDDRDPHSNLGRFPALDASENHHVEDVRVAWSPDMGYATVSSDAEDALQVVVRTLEGLCVNVSRSHPQTQYPFEIWPTIARVEEYAAFGHLLEDGADEMTPDIRIRLETGRDTPAVEYVRCYDAMLRFRASFGSFFRKYDILMTPMNAIPAFDRDGGPPDAVDGKPIKPDWEGFTPFAISANLAALPAATIPVGFSEDGLPMGVMLMARRGEDSLLLNVCNAIERTLDDSSRRPLL